MFVIFVLSLPSFFAPVLSFTSHSHPHTTHPHPDIFLQADHLIGASGKSGSDAAAADGEGWTSNLAPTTLPVLNKNAPGGLELDWVHGYRCHDVRNNLRYSALRKVGSTIQPAHLYTR